MTTVATCDHLPPHLKPFPLLDGAQHKHHTFRLHHPLLHTTHVKWSKQSAVTHELGGGCFLPLQVPTGDRRHATVSRPPSHATPAGLARRHNGAGLSPQMCDGAEKHRERWKGFDRSWQNSISRVQSGSEKLDLNLSKDYIKIWRLWKIDILPKDFRHCLQIISGDRRPTLSYIIKVLPNSDWYLFPFLGDNFYN